MPTPTPTLEGRTREFLIWQMLGSKEAIEARTGVPVRCFCYPSGAYDGLAQQMLHELGYWAATIVTHGQEHSSAGLFELRRLRVRGSYSPAQLAALLEAG
jgi:peptidoglycan/xylan/chitin deacetylase (PgdA/CDA1 family)